MGEYENGVIKRYIYAKYNTNNIETLRFINDKYSVNRIFFKIEMYQLINAIWSTGGRAFRKES